jgi:hypothetical protein
LGTRVIVHAAEQLEVSISITHCAVLWGYELGKEEALKLGINFNWTELSSFTLCLESIIFISWSLRRFVELHHLNSQSWRESAAEGALTILGLDFRVHEIFLFFTLHMFAEWRCAMVSYWRAAPNAEATPADIYTHCLVLPPFRCGHVAFAFLKPHGGTMTASVDPMVAKSFSIRSWEDNE